MRTVVLLDFTHPVVEEKRSHLGSLPGSLDVHERPDLAVFFSSDDGTMEGQPCLIFIDGEPEIPTAFREVPIVRVEFSELGRDELGVIVIDAPATLDDALAALHRTKKERDVTRLAIYLRALARVERADFDDLLRLTQDEAHIREDLGSLVGYGLITDDGFDYWSISEAGRAAL